MTNKLWMVAFVALVLGSFMVPALAGATGEIVPAPDPNEYSQAGGFMQLLSRIINILFTLLLILAVIFILWAAFKYLTAGGNAEKVQEAGKMVLYAVVAIAVAVLAKAVPSIVCNILDVQCYIPTAIQ